MTKWTTADMLSQTGRRALVTGTGGLGYETALALARAGASVVLAGRNAQKGADAVAAIRAAVPQASVRFGQVDLADLGSIRRFAADMMVAEPGLDLLVNNAGVMTPPDRRETHDGFELQFGTNHLGHVALTAGLLPLLRAGTAPRVINLSSIAARGGKIDFDDLQATRSYRPMAAYSQSKLACLMFSREFSRQSRAAGWGIESIAAHPGIARTDLLVNGPGRTSLQGVVRRYLSVLFQPAAQGAWPTLFAATSDTARDGGYYGPDRMGGTRGYPVEEIAPKPAMDRAASRRLWDVSIDLAGVTFA